MRRNSKALILALWLIATGFVPVDAWNELPAQGKREYLQMLGRLYLRHARDCKEARVEKPERWPGFKNVYAFRVSCAQGIA